MALRFPGGDLVAPLRFPEVAVSGVTTARPGVMHVCSGTAADYTVTLPPVSSCAGKHIGFRMAAGLTKLVTLKGDGAELIDGLNSRVLWANEVAVLYCDGTTWTKVSGKSIPMSASLGMGSAQTFAASVTTLLTFSKSVFTKAPAAFVTPANYKITIQRPGEYSVCARGYTNSTNATANLSQFLVAKNGSVGKLDTGCYGPANQQVALKIADQLLLATGDYLQIYGCYYNGSFNTSWLYDDAAIAEAPWNAFTVTEIPTW